MVRVAREQAGLQQGDLADRLGVPQSVLSKIEAAHREVTMLELRVICAALSLTLVDFAGKLESDLQADQEG